MPETPVVLRGGTVVTPQAEARMDILIRDGRIAAVGTNLEIPGAIARDVHGLIIIPGPIDPHVHIAWPYHDTRTEDDFQSATAAAAWGGTTTVVDWAIQRGESLLEAIAARRAEADGAAVTDYALHGTVTGITGTLRAELPRLHEAGVAVLKLYMTYRKRGIMADDGMLWYVLNAARDLGYTVSVHAENPFLHEWNEAELRAAGVTGAPAHALHKPHIVETEAIHRIIYLAREARCPLLIRHVSTAAGVELIRRARAAGADVIGETCPQYLYLTDAVFQKPDGYLYICSPSVRTDADRLALWKGLADGTLSVVGSDHAAFPRRAKVGATAFDVPNGLPGIETRVPLLFAGVKEGRLSLCRFVDVVSSAAARIYGLYPRKGAILPGSDADLVVIDPKERFVLTASALHMAVDWSPYEGLAVRGYPVMTIIGGRILVDGRSMIERPPAGCFLHCRRRQDIHHLADLAAAPVMS